jgi:S-adenosylmethionine synthetase
MLKQDPFARVACEVSVAMGMVIVLGEITCKGYVEIPEDCAPGNQGGRLYQTRIWL